MNTGRDPTSNDVIQRYPTTSFDSIGLHRTSSDIRRHPMSSEDVFRRNWDNLIGSAVTKKNLKI